jgi:hypothetical protein
VTISPTGSTSASKPGSTNRSTWRCLDAQAGRIEIRLVKGRWHKFTNRFFSLLTACD